MPPLRVELAATGRVAAAAAATLPRLVRPRRPPAALLESITSVAAPPARGGVTVRALTQNRFHAPTPVVVEGSWRPPRTLMTMGAFLVEHTQARFLVDAGICADVGRRHLCHMPFAIRTLVEGSPPQTGIADAVAQQGLDPGQVDFVVLTHVHWDHCSGLAELPHVAVRLSAAELDFSASPPRALVLHGVLPQAYAEARFQPFALDGPPVETFERSLDLFGDGSAVLVDLPGHTPGHIGVLLTLHSGRRLLLCGDAVWSATQATLAREKAPLPGNIIDVDRQEAYRSVLRLHKLGRGITLLPAHDLGSIEAAFAAGMLS